MESLEDPAPAHFQLLRAEPDRVDVVGGAATGSFQGRVEPREGPERFRVPRRKGPPARDAGAEFLELTESQCALEVCQAEVVSRSWDVIEPRRSARRLHDPMGR